MTGGREYLTEATAVLRKNGRWTVNLGRQSWRRFWRLTEEHTTTSQMRLGLLALNLGSKLVERLSDHREQFYAVRIHLEAVPVASATQHRGIALHAAVSVESEASHEHIHQWTTEMINSQSADTQIGEPMWIERIQVNVYSSMILRIG